MLLDEKGRLFGKISIVDIGVLLLIAVLIGLSLLHISEPTRPY